MLRVDFLVKPINKLRQTYEKLSENNYGNKKTGTSKNHQPDRHHRIGACRL
jgi:hypothetical protein